MVDDTHSNLSGLQYESDCHASASTDRENEKADAAFAISRSRVAVVHLRQPRMRNAIAIIGDRNPSYFHSIEVTAFLHSIPRTAIILTLGISGVCRIVERLAKEHHFSRAVYEVSNWSSRSRYELAEATCATRMVNDATHVVAFWNARRNDVINCAIRTAFLANKTIDVFTEDVTRTCRMIDREGDHLRIFNPKRLDL
jgi:hypothetical protein